jgi:starvation-inducible outer membrane lipoprotein
VEYGFDRCPITNNHYLGAVMRILLLSFVLALSGCATVDSIFGPPFQSMSQEQIATYCVQWPDDNMCKRWRAGEFSGPK